MLTDDQIKSIYRASPTASLILHPDAPNFTIVYANEAYLGTTNTNLENLVGKTLFEVFPEHAKEGNVNRKEKLQLSLNHALHQKEAHRILLYRYDIKKKDSDQYETRYWNNDAYPLLDENNEVMYLVLNPLDVTEKVTIMKESSNSTNKLLTKKNISHPLFKEIPDAIFTLDHKGRFISFNKALPELLECAADSLLQSSFIPFITPEDLESVENHFKHGLMWRGANLRAHDCYRQRQPPDR